MQGVNIRVPVSKCLDLATYSIRMLSKFPDNVVLAGLGASLKVEQDDLGARQAAYEQAVREIIAARVDVSFENFSSDRRVRQTHRKAELADGKQGGKISSALFPDGSNVITRLQGDSQIQAMQDLEGRLEANKSLWNEAASEKADIAAHRDRYAKALKSRHDAGQKARDLRALRDAAKDRFVTKYLQAQSQVEVEFPRDKLMQELFFDDVRSKSSLEEADEGGETPAPTTPT